MEKEIMDLEHYGKYRMGLTNEEIKDYLKKRAGTKKLGHLYKRFTSIAGVNTMALVDGQTLMYRWDVVRFANVMFSGTTTYFD